MYNHWTIYAFAVLQTFSRDDVTCKTYRQYVTRNSDEYLPYYALLGQNDSINDVKTSTSCQQLLCIWFVKAVPIALSKVLMNIKQDPPGRIVIVTRSGGTEGGRRPLINLIGQRRP